MDNIYADVDISVITQYRPLAETLFTSRVNNPMLERSGVCADLQPTRGLKQTKTKKLYSEWLYVNIGRAYFIVHASFCNTHSQCRPAARLSPLQRTQVCGRQPGSGQSTTARAGVVFPAAINTNTQTSRFMIPMAFEKFLDVPCQLPPL